MIDAYKIYEESTICHSDKIRYFLTLELAEKGYQQLIDEVKKKHECNIFTDKELEETMIGFKKNLCEQKSRLIDGNVIKRFLIAFDENGTEHYANFSTIVLEKIRIEDE